jgi:hypothetical protein
MPARITIKAELQNLLNKAQALTDANRLSQLEGERRRRAEREQLAAKKVKAEEEERRRRALDDPTMRNIRTAAMGQQQRGLAFALIPSAGFDESITGPFGEIRIPQWTEEWGGHGAANGLARGYTNTLWGLQARWFLAFESRYPNGEPISDFTQCVIINEPQHLVRRPVLSGGGYQTQPVTYRFDGCGGQPGSYQDVTHGAFRIGHAIADGTAIKYTQNQSGQFIAIPTEEILTFSRPPLSSATLECIVKLGSNAPTDTTGYARFFLQVQNANNSNMSIDLELEKRNLSLPGFFTTEYQGEELHVAQVLTASSRNIYINGQLVLEQPSSESFLANTGPLFLTLELIDEAHDAYTEVGGDPNFWAPWPEFTTVYNGPSTLKAVRFTDRALYSGNSFIPPASITRLA